MARSGYLAVSLGSMKRRANITRWRRSHGAEASSDAIEVAPNVRWLVTAGTPGLAPDGTLPAAGDD